MECQTGQGFDRRTLKPVNSSRSTRLGDGTWPMIRGREKPGFGNIDTESAAHGTVKRKGSDQREPLQDSCIQGERHDERCELDYTILSALRLDKLLKKWAWDEGRDFGTIY